MEHFRVLELLPYNANQLERLNVTGASHNNGQRQKRGTNKAEKFVLVDGVFVERIIGKFTLGYINCFKVLNVIPNDLNY